MARDLKKDPPLPRLIFGLAVLAAGVAFWLDRIGRIEARDYLEWWPLALIAVGLANLPHRRWFAAAFWTVVGTYWLLPLLGLPRLHFWRILGLWPLIISAGGAALVVQAWRGARHPSSLRAVAVMAGNVRKVGAQFKGGEALAVMGGVDLDFSSATIAGEAIIEVLAFWGAIEIKVPRGWKIISEVTPILGGYDDKTDSAPDGAPRLIVRGAVIGAGIDVHHPKESAG